MIEDFFTQLTWLQAIGTTFGVVQVLLARKNNIDNYLFGIVAILISLWVLYQSKLYADIILTMLTGGIVHTIIGVEMAPLKELIHPLLYK